MQGIKRYYQHNVDTGETINHGFIQNRLNPLEITMPFAGVVRVDVSTQNAKSGQLVAKVYHNDVVKLEARAGTSVSTITDKGHASILLEVKAGDIIYAFNSVSVFIVESL